MLQDFLNKKETLIKGSFQEAESLVVVASYLESTLYHLMVNAMKFRHTDRQLEITIHSFYQGNFIGLSVKDNGIGIDLDLHKENLFGLFKQFHDHVDGRGLGLYLVKSQVQAQGGQVKVESAVGKGTTFTLLFPIRSITQKN
jgi:signal transduction histidine kinase